MNRNGWATPGGVSNVGGANARRILVVDDNQDSAEMVAEALLEFGHQVEVALDGPSALTAAESFQPDVALVDIGLPLMDGYELARRLRASGGVPKHLRLIAVTGHGLESDRRRAEEAGFHKHLIKPLDLMILKQVVEDLHS
jgi:CheY-like chemotaxis protein